MRVAVKVIFWTTILLSIVSAAIIKPGDVLTITVQNHVEYSGNFSVDDNGNCDYPLLSDERVANSSTGELAQDLTIRLAKHVANPMVSVIVDPNPPITVLVLGEIMNPGPVKSYDGVSVQEILRAAGGPQKGADIANIRVLRKNQSDDQALVFNLDTFLIKGNIDEMPRLHNGDRLVLLTKKHSSKVKVIGAITRPGFYEPEERVNLFELIYLAGGPAEKADLSRVRRMFQMNGKTMDELVDVQSYIDKGQIENIPFVNEGDVIIIYTKWFDWRTVLTVLNNTLLFIVTVQAFSGIFK